MIAINRDTLNSAVDNTLDPAERALLDAELGQNPELLAELRELQATSLLLSSLPELRPRRSFVLGAEFAKPTPLPTSAANGALRLLPFVRTLSVAAALIFMVVAGSLFFEINGDSESNAGQTFQQQAVILGETGDPSEASIHAEDETSADEDSGELVERGDSASAADEPMGDLSASAPEAESANENSVNAAPAPSTGATEQSDTDHANWIFMSVMLGVATIALGLAWLAISNTARQRQT